MNAWAPSPGPIAVALLALEERGADGSVDFGGRRIVLRRGKVVEVTRAPSDASLVELLRAMGKIGDADVAKLLATCPDPDVVPENLPGVSADALEDAIRTVWLDRLVHALAQADAAGEPVPALRPAPSRPSAIEVGFFTLLMDALERRAADGEAEEVGKRAGQMLEWTEGALAARARKWAGLGPVAEAASMRVGQVLSSTPSAPSRVAALVRAGIVRISASKTSIPAPASRLSLAPPGSDAERSSLPPRKAPELRLAPGATRAFDEEIVPPPLPSLPQRGKPLDDPFAPLERRIAALEQKGAAPADRAAAWRALGDALRARCGSIEEQLRCYREAVAATPQDGELLAMTSELCAATQQIDLALAYGRAAVATRTDADGRRQALLSYARLARRIGRVGDALAAARAATTLGEHDPMPRVLSGQLEADAGLYEDAVADWIEAAIATRATDPTLAHALLGSAYFLAPGERIADAFATSLTELGFTDAALAVRARAALSFPDADARRRGLLSTAERAELAGRPSLAADLLLAAFAEEPEFDLLYEPLDADLEQAGRLVERALVLEAIAESAGSEAEEWGLRAARAWLAIESDEARATGIAVLVRMAAESSGRAASELSRMAEQGDPEAFDGLEEAARRARTRETRNALLDELTRRAGTKQPGRLAWAMSTKGLAAPTTVEAEIAEEEKRVMRALGELGRGGTVPPGAIFDAVGHGRRLPEARSGVIAMLAQVATRDARAALAGAALARLSADDAAVERILASAPTTGDGAARVARERARAAQGPAAAAGAWATALKIEPGSEEARVRLVRAARASRDPDRIGHALAERLAYATTTAEECRVALELVDVVRASDPVHASELAERALAADPNEPRAALVLLGLASARTPSAPAVAVIRSLLGETAEGHALACRAAAADADALAATVRWAALAPCSPAPLAVALEESASRGIDDYLEAGIVALLESQRLGLEVEPVAARVLERIAVGDRLERSSELALRAATRLGAAGPRLATLARELAERTGNPKRVRDARELSLAVASREERVVLLGQLAEHHHKGGDTPSEMRALLRLLAVQPRDGASVDRLAAIHAEAGNHEQMLAALALRTDEGASAVERAIGMLSLAKANLEVVRDERRAEEFLAAAIEPPEAEESDPQWLERITTVALGLVSLGRGARAIDLLETQAAPDRMGAHKLVERAVDIALRELRDRDRALAVLQAELARRHALRGRLLLMFEQLTLDRRDVALAERVYGALIDGAMGESGRRALRYRRARWLEKAGSGRAALAAYVEACEHASSTGAIASAVERLARELGDLESLTQGLMALSRAAPHPVLSERLVRRAARVMLEEMARPERAFDVLFASWKESFSADVEDDLARAATATEEVDAERGASAFAGIFEVLRARADEAWTGEEKGRLLRKLARVHRARGDLAQAEAVAREAIAAQRADDPDEMALAGALVELGTWLERTKPGDARTLVTEALGLHPESEDGKALAARLAAAAQASSAPASVRPPARAGGSDVVTSARRASGTSTPRASAPPPPSAPTPAVAAPSAVPAAAVAAPSSSGARFVPVDEADADAGTEEPSQRVSLLDLYRPMSSPPPQRSPIALPEVEPTKTEIDLILERAGAASRALESEAACALLRSALVLDPGRPDIAERLAREAEASGRDGERLLALGAVATGQRAIGGWDVSPQAARGALAAELVHPAHAPVLGVLRRVYESCQPLFRMQLAQLGVVGTDRVGSRGASPVARALLAAIELFGWEEPHLFVSRQSIVTELVRTQPPALVIGMDLPRNERELRFVIGRGLTLARPENVLVASLPPAEGATLLAAIRAAFGPADGTRVSREAAALASELWRMLSPARQRDVRELLANAWDTLDYPSVRASIEGGAARAGLLLAGDVGAALRGLALVSEPRVTLSDGQPCLTLARTHGPAADLVRFAFGDALVDAVRVLR